MSNEENSSEDFNTLAAEAADKVKNAASKVGERASDALKGIMNNSANPDELVGKAGETLSKGLDALKQSEGGKVLSGLENRINEHPVASAGIAFVAGFIVCKLMSGSGAR